MEVDPPTSSSPSSPMQSSNSTLKRSNSAPMINMLVASQPDTSPQSSFKPINTVALRRLSSSNMMLNNIQASTSPPIRGTDRVARIKQEEIHIADRERQHERETQSSFWISNNWDYLSLDHAEPMESQQRRPRSFSESLHIMTQSNILCGSPSPTRPATKQCFSPSMQIPVKNTTFTPSPSPSPTRKNFMRSLSPIAVRTGFMKRKLENDGDRWDYLSPPKKFNTGPSTPDHLMTHIHPLANSISSSSLEGSSPEQQALSRTSSTGNNNSSSSSSSAGSGTVLHTHHGAVPPMGGRPTMFSINVLGANQHQPLSSPMSSSGAPSPLSSGSSTGGGGGHGVGQASGAVSASGHAAHAHHQLSSKPSPQGGGFLFLPVPSSETAMGRSPSSASSSPSPSAHPHDPHQLQAHHMHHDGGPPSHPHHQQQQQQQPNAPLDPHPHADPHTHHQGPGISPNAAAVSGNLDDHCMDGSSHDGRDHRQHHHHQHHHHHHHHHHQGDMGNHHHPSGADVYMNDSEMRDHSKPSGMEEVEGGYNFKPISPDHGS